MHLLPHMPAYVNWSLSALMIAWIFTGVFFLIGMLRANRISSREAGAARLLDALLLWGGYYLLMVPLVPWAALNRRFAPAALAPLAAGVAILGLILACFSRFFLGRYWSGTVALKQDHKLIQNGPYRFVRHPLYSGLILAVFGTACAFGVWHRLLGAGLLFACFLRRAFKEDRLMQSRFGAEFDAWRRRTGQIVPGIG